jgi:hypothetical protein
VHVRYRLLKSDGTRWNLSEMDFARILLSGPASNYQRVIPEQSDVLARSVQRSDGSYDYSFADPLPAAYLAPLNDSADPLASEGERTGQDLIEGTYTVGLAFAWNYEVSKRPFVDAGNATADFRLGGSAVLLHREVVDQASCERCHVQLQYHEGRWRDVTACLLCHTSGAEDGNDPAVESGTPGVSIDFRVLMHKLHNARHLPSLYGVTTTDDGRRDYTAPPKPYRLARADGTVRDFSEVGFPVWPNRTIPMIKDTFWSSRTPAEQAVEDVIRTGVTDCSVCHGGPLGSGLPPGPAQGGLAYAEPSIRSCYACHDDMVVGFPYVSNQVDADPPGMAAQFDSSQCKTCHSPFGSFPGESGGITVEGSHRHPIKDPFFHNFNQVHGLHVEIESLSEHGASDGDGRIDPGERVEVEVSMKDDQGGDVPVSDVAKITAIVSGPTSNANLVLVADVPKGSLTLPQPFRFRLPELRQLELVGRSTAATGDVFTTSSAPHLSFTGSLTVVRVRTGTSGGASALAAAAIPPQNFADVANASGFQRDDFVVVDDGTPDEEYARIQLVDGNRLWFSSPAAPAYPPGLLRAHAAGATVQEVSLVQKFPFVDYALDANAGTITEITEFGAGNAVLVTYTTEFAMPSAYPLPLNASPGLDETSGKWTGKSLVDGTYTLTITAYRDVAWDFFGETNTLYDTSPPATRDFLVGSADRVEPYAAIDSPTSCYRCHTDIWFHEGRYRGFETCIACHGQAGSEDRPRYVAANAPSTDGVTVNFRSLLHKIHRGKMLASAFRVVGEGAGPYPDNFQVATFDEYQFPAMPRATAQCAKCHGDASTAWLAPSNRDHPSEQGSPVLAWRIVCAACHDGASTLAHFEDELGPGGQDVCQDCHAPGAGDEAVDVAHKH